MAFGSLASCIPGHLQTHIGLSAEPASRAATSRPVHPVNPCSSWTKYRSPARVRRPPNGSAFAWRLGFCGSPPGRSDCPWERGRPARILFLLGVVEHQRDFAGSHHVGKNRNGQAEGEPRRRCRSIQVEELAEAAPGFGVGGTPALPGSHHPHDKPGPWFTRSQGIQQGALCRPQESLPPLRGSRQDKGEARSRAGGGQTPCAVSGYPARGQRAGSALPPGRVKDFAWPPIGICRTIGRERGGAPGFGLPAPAPSGKPGDTR